MQIVLVVLNAETEDTLERWAFDIEKERDRASLRILYFGILQADLNLIEREEREKSSNKERAGRKSSSTTRRCKKG